METFPRSKAIRGKVRAEQLIAMRGPWPFAPSWRVLFVSGERASGLGNAYARPEPRFSRTGS